MSERRRRHRKIRVRVVDDPVEYRRRQLRKWWAVASKILFWMAVIGALALVQYHFIERAAQPPPPEQ